MVRLPRLCLPEIPQHIIQRGINREPCFTAEEGFSAYAHWRKITSYLDIYEEPYAHVSDISNRKIMILIYLRTIKNGLY